MVEVLQEQEIEESNELSASDLIAALKDIKMEEQELLRQRKDLQETESELRNQAKEEIDGKKKVISSLKSEIASLTNQCNELEQALNIPVYK
jgi:predicted transcriptional regulator